MTTKVKNTFKRPQIRDAFSPKNRVVPPQGGPSYTKQSFAKETDINFLMERYKKTGQVPATDNRVPEYGYAPSQDFQEALEIVQNARTMFSELPSQVRQGFDNDPVKLLAFVEDPANGPEEFAAKGLTTAPVEEVPPVYPTAASLPGEPYRGSETPPVSNPDPLAAKA